MLVASVGAKEVTHCELSGRALAYCFLVFVIVALCLHILCVLFVYEIFVLVYTLKRVGKG